MKFYSTSNPAHKVSFSEAVLKGLAPDNGLYMPEHIPILDSGFYHAIDQLSFKEIAFHVAQTLLENEIPEKDLRKIIDQTITFDAPLVQLEEDVFALELFHGPTLAFKDFGARFMSEVLSYLSNKLQVSSTVLVATSGDTGSAVANGFLGVERTRVIVLYPSGKVSDVQEKQFTTLGKNITALEIDGTFDDCQRMVKEVFANPELAKRLTLTSANSINIARLVPQMFYYFHAYAQAKKRGKSIMMSVPSGNFGNLTAGLLARRMGLPIDHFIAATNANDIFPVFLSTDQFRPKPSVQTISNAMDVGNPSNFFRVLDLYSNDLRQIKAAISSCSISDEETTKTMSEVFSTLGYTLDPHGAVGYAALKRFMAKNSGAVTGIFLETAHPAKFVEVVEDAIGEKIQMPPELRSFINGKKVSVPMKSSFQSLKEFLLDLPV